MANLVHPPYVDIFFLGNNLSVNTCKLWEETVLAYFRVLSLHLPEENKGKHEKPQLIESPSQPRFESASWEHKSKKLRLNQFACSSKVLFIYFHN